MQDTSDGFAIAEEDLLLRGPGEVYGTRQHGMPALRLATIMRDVRVLEDARDAAQSLVERDPKLAESEHGALRDRVTALRARMETMSG
jgi:ATP-dependent DNA helicase RecG